PARPPTPAEWARRELDRIESFALPESGDPEHFSTLVSQVVRHYLQLRFDLQAPRQTTAEFLTAVRGDPRLSPADRELVRDLLEQCDLAKFARSGLSGGERATLITAARQLVEQTSAAGRAAEFHTRAERNGGTG